LWLRGGGEIAIVCAILGYKTKSLRPIPFYIALRNPFSAAYISTTLLVFGRS
jgi:hypothetical protein